MKVTAFHPIEDIRVAFGLRPIDMQRLGSTVVLAGPNGGGKTRILSALRQVLSFSHDRARRLAEAEANVVRMRREIELAERDKTSTEFLTIDDKVRFLQSWQQTLDALNQICLEENPPSNTQVQVVNFVPKLVVLAMTCHSRSNDALCSEERCG